MRTKAPLALLLALFVALAVSACAGGEPYEHEATRTDGSQVVGATDDAANAAAAAKNLRNYLKGTWKVVSVDGIKEGIVQDVDASVVFTGSATDLLKSGNNPMSIEAATDSIEFGNTGAIDGQITITDSSGDITFDVDALDGDTLEVKLGADAVIKLIRTEAVEKKKEEEQKESIVAGYLVGDWKTADGRMVTFDGTYTNFISETAALPYVVSEDEYTVEIRPKEGDPEIFWVRIEDDDYIRLSRDGNRVYLSRVSHTPTKPEEGGPKEPTEDEGDSEEKEPEEADKEDKKDEEEPKEEGESAEGEAEDKAPETEGTEDADPKSEEAPLGSTYQLVAEGVTWEAAKAACEAMGGHLVTIETSDELSEVSGIVAGSSLHTVWIGLYRGSGSWTWVNGNGVTFTNWAPDRPTADGGTYVEMFVDTRGDARGSLGQWSNAPNEGGSDFYSLATKGYICEWD